MKAVQLLCGDYYMPKETDHLSKETYFSFDTSYFILHILHILHVILYLLSLGAVVVGAAVSAHGTYYLSKETYYVSKDTYYLSKET